MGLDAVAYDRFIRLHDHTFDPDNCHLCDDSQHIFTFAYASFPDSYDGLPMDDIPAQWDTSRCIGFGLVTVEYADVVRAPHHSYSGYGVFRRKLFELFSKRELEEWWENPDPDMPFYELVNFADNEGCIGPNACARLASDFNTYEIDATSSDDELFTDQYRGWMAAFDFAAHTGFVRFR